MKPTGVDGQAAGAVLARMSAYEPIARGLARRAPIELRTQGFVRTGVAATARLAEATLPRTANAPIHLVPRLAADAWADVRGLDVESALGELHENAAVYAEVAPATDVVMTAEATRVEETRLLRDPSAPTTFRYRIDLGPGISEAHVRSGMVELADAHGYVHLSTDVAFAVDAKGVVRELSVALKGEGATRTMIASLDTQGLTYPIAVDPVWTTAPSQPGGPRSNVAIALPTSGRVLVLGGFSPYTCLYDPTTNTWAGGSLAGSTVPLVPIDWRDTATGNPPFLRATLLADNTVLVAAGGLTDTRFAIFHDTTIPTYTVPANRQIAVCQGCGLVTLPDGRVFKVNGGGATSTEIYTPSTGLWTASNASPVANPGEPVVVALKGPYAGRVFEFGGNPAQSAAMWTSGTGWGALLGGRRFVGARGVALADGRAFIGGLPTGSGTVPLVAQLFQPSSSSLTDTAISPSATAGVGLVLLPSGLVLAAGGDNAGSPVVATTASSIYDPTGDVWTAIDALPTAQAEQALVVMRNNAVMSVGGIGGASPSVAAQIFTPLAQGASCAAPLRAQTCVTGYCVNATCCTTASCPNGVCNAPAVTGRAAGVCALNNGQMCTTNANCASNFCVDGVCCNSVCNGQCEACNGGGTAGTCTAVTGTPVAPRGACTGVGTGTSCGPTCNGTTRASCTYAPAGTVACGAATCTSGTMTTPSKCNGAGVCPSTSSSCGAYACGPTACLTTCSNDSFCTSGYYCDLPSSTCVPKTGLGATCTGTSMCPSGTYCTDGVCCGVASCGAGSSCALGTAGGPIPPGTCSKANGTQCGSNGECGSQHCVDGVCCNTACTEQCAACDVTGKVGSCSPVLGAPHGTARTPCDDGGANKCGAKQCDGTASTGSCNAYVNDGTVKCAPAQCTGGSLLPAAVCDGAGSCATPTLSACGKYACDPVALACKTSCATNADCAGDSVCKSGVCSDAATCSADYTQSIDPVTKTPTNCTPYRCASSGACGTTCATSDDCLTGFLCDLSSGTGSCTPAATGTSSSGGCALTPGDDARGAWSAIAVGALGCLLLGARKRRR
jgi:hypothetical protein